MKIVNKEKQINGIHSPCNQVKLTRKEHNKLFKYRQRNIFIGYDVYITKDSELKYATGAIRKTITPLGIVLQTILLPIQILIDGLGNIKDTWKSYKSDKCNWEMFSNYDLTKYK